MTSTERNATVRPGLGLVITLLMLAMAAVLIATGLGDRVKPMLRYAAAGASMLFTIIAIIAALSAQRRWTRLLEAVEAKPMIAAPVVRYSFWSGASLVLSTRSSSGMMPFRGVRISWLMVARNSPLAIIAASASTFAEVRSRSTLRRRSISVSSSR